MISGYGMLMRCGYRKSHLDLRESHEDLYETKYSKRYPNVLMMSTTLLNGALKISKLRLRGFCQNIVVVCMMYTWTENGLTYRGGWYIWRLRPSNISRECVSRKNSLLGNINMVDTKSLRSHRMGGHNEKFQEK